MENSVDPNQICPFLKEQSKACTINCTGPVKTAQVQLLSGPLTLSGKQIIMLCTTIHRYPIFSTRYSVMCKVYTGYCGTSEIEHGLCDCTFDNPLAKARGLSLRTGAQTMLYLSHILKTVLRQKLHSSSKCMALLKP